MCLSGAVNLLARPSADNSARGWHVLGQFHAVCLVDSSVPVRKTTSIHRCSQGVSEVLVRDQTIGICTSFKVSTETTSASSISLPNTPSPDPNRPVSSSPSSTFESLLRKVPLACGRSHCVQRNRLFSRLLGTSRRHPGLIIRSQATSTILLRLYSLTVSVSASTITRPSSRHRRVLWLHSLGALSSDWLGALSNALK